jgi:predicted transcriptional regulator
LDIYVDILWSINNGLQHKEDIIDATGITSSIMNEILDSLKSMDLILEVVKPNWDSKSMITLFDFTEKGKRVMEYLKYCEKVTEGLDLGDLNRKDDIHRNNNSNL